VAALTAAADVIGQLLQNHHQVRVCLCVVSCERWPASWACGNCLCMYVFTWELLEGCCVCAHWVPACSGRCVRVVKHCTR
jgi:hypothetical protein